MSSVETPPHTEPIESNWRDEDHQSLARIERAYDDSHPLALHLAVYPIYGAIMGVASGKWEFGVAMTLLGLGIEAYDFIRGR